MAERTRVGRPLGSLPSFARVPLGEAVVLADGAANGMAAFQCMRRTCKGVFVVDEDAWREGRNLAHTTEGRACPYCFRPSFPPTQEDQP